MLSRVEQRSREDLWIRNWFSRQNSKATALNRKAQVSNVRARLTSVPSASFALQDYQLAVPLATHELLPVHIPNHLPISGTTDGLLESLYNPQGSPSATRAAKAPRDNSPSSYSLSDVLSAYNFESSTTNAFTPLQTTATEAKVSDMCLPYSRDPLYGRYPDFSQFFHPLVHDMFRSSVEVPNVLHPLADLQSVQAFCMSLPFLQSGSAFPNLHFPAFPTAFSVKISDLFHAQESLTR